jgi:PIN domain nuclease of toxin-antitoxin system
MPMEFQFDETGDILYHICEKKCVSFVVCHEIFKRWQYGSLSVCKPFAHWIAVVKTHASGKIRESFN